MTEKKAVDMLNVDCGSLYLVMQNETKTRAEVVEQCGNVPKYQHAEKNKNEEDSLYKGYKFARLKGATCKWPIFIGKIIGVSTSDEPH